MNDTQKLQHARMMQERYEIQWFDNADAKKAAAEIEFLPEQICEQWVKLIWYSDACGGKLITFKAGNPYLPKTGIRKNGENYTDAERETKRLANSLSRTRKLIFEKAACNEWEWFFTGTLDGEKCDRYDLNGTFRRLSQFVRDYRKKTGYDVKYLIVPEQHKDGAWHFHGLLSGLPETALHKFDPKIENLPLRLKRTIKNGYDVFTWCDYADKFGYSTITAVRDTNAVSCYVTKYITKDMVKENASTGTRRHLFYASQGLQKPETIAESYPGTSYAPDYDFENDWVQIRKIASRDEMEQIIARYGLKRG